MGLIKNISLYLVVSALFLIFNYLIKSDFSFIYLKENLIDIQVTVFAINAAIYSLLIVEVSRMNRQFGNFKNTIRELKISVWEQVILLAFSFVVLNLESSSVRFENSRFIFEYLLIFCFIYTIDVLRDLVFSIFQIFK